MTKILLVDGKGLSKKAASAIGKELRKKCDL